MILQSRRQATVGVLLLIIACIEGNSLRGNRELESDLGDLFGDTDGSAGDQLDITLPEKFYGPNVQVGAETQSGGEKADTGDNRIVGGSDANPDVDTFYTMILRSGSSGYAFSGCGATLIGNCHALTAAHCVTGSRTGVSNAVYIGAYQPYSGNSGKPYHFTTVSSVEYHESYVDATNRHDVAILRFTDCLSSTQLASIKPVQLATSNYYMNEGESLYALGFGRLSESNTVAVQTLQKVMVPYIPYTDCDAMYGGSYTVYDDMVCAGVSSGGQDACQGDSGGPLVRYTSSGIVQVGVVSWGVGCARAGLPGVYSSVSAHYDWIKSHVCSDASTDQSLSLCSSSTYSASVPAPSPVSNSAPTRTYGGAGGARRTRSPS